MFERVCVSCLRKSFLVAKARSIYCKPCAASMIKSRGGHVELNGYRIIYINKRKIYQHRHVMEQVLGRKLDRKEHVHHKDGDRLNNDPSNLEILSASEHARQHMDSATAKAKSMLAVQALRRKQRANLRL